MRRNWLQTCKEFAREPADFFSGSRKVLRRRMIVFDEIKDDLSLYECGYTQNKMKQLVRHYLHEESHQVAQRLWKRRLDQGKYGSVGITCYNHFVKAEQVSIRSSVMGPCIQSIVITLREDHKVDVDAFYRTTELFKKFPADLIFMRDVLLKPFDIEVNTLAFHFANVTIHPMYIVTLLPLLKNPIKELLEIKAADPKFFRFIVKWTSCYVCPEKINGIINYSQAMRVHLDTQTRIKEPLMSELQDLMRDNFHMLGRQAKED